MNTEQWLAKARTNADKIRQIVSQYHPCALSPGMPLPITAPAAERACKHFRGQIMAESKGDPVQRFDKSIADGDVPTLLGLLDETWLGVPESTDCWRITGFAEIVDLMEDAPTED